MSLNSYSSTGKSGTGTATNTATAIGTLNINAHVMIQVLDTEAAGVEVIYLGSTEGIIVESGKEQSFLCDDLNKILIKRVGGSDIQFRYWAF
jgi:hypothetical protein